MKKQITLLFAAFVAVLFFAGCKHNSDNAKPNFHKKVVLENLPAGISSVAVNGNYFTLTSNVKSEASNEIEVWYSGSEPMKLKIEFDNKLDDGSNKWFFDENGNILGMLVDSKNFKVFANGAEVKFAEPPSRDDDFKETNYLPFFYGEFPVADTVTLTFEGAPKKVAAKDIKLLENTEYAYVEVDKSLLKGLNVYLRQNVDENGTGGTAVDKVLDLNENFLFYVKPGEEVSLITTYKFGYGRTAAWAFNFGDSALEPVNVNDPSPRFLSKTFTITGQTGDVIKITGTPAVQSPYYATRIEQYSQKILHQEIQKPCDINNLKLTFDSDGTFEMLCDDKTRTGLYKIDKPYEMADETIKLRFNDEDYLEGSYPYEFKFESDGAWKLKKNYYDGPDDPDYFKDYYKVFFASKDVTTKMTKKTVSLYSEKNYPVEVGTEPKLNLKFIGVDKNDIPQSTEIKIVYQSMFSDDKTETCSLTNVTDWNSFVTDAILTLPSFGDLFTGRVKISTTAAGNNSNEFGMIINMKDNFKGHTFYAIKQPGSNINHAKVVFNADGTSVITADDDTFNGVGYSIAEHMLDIYDSQGADKVRLSFDTKYSESHPNPDFDYPYAGELLIYTNPYKKACITDIQSDGSPCQSIGLHLHDPADSGYTSQITVARGSTVTLDVQLLNISPTPSKVKLVDSDKKEIGEYTLGNVTTWSDYITDATIQFDTNTIPADANGISLHLNCNNITTAGYVTIMVN